MTRYRIKEDLEDDEEVIEVLEADEYTSTDWRDLLRTKGAIEYPYKPYYRIPTDVYKKYQYLCTEDGFVTDCISMFVKHVGTHSKDDAYDVLKHNAKMNIEEKLRRRSPNEYIPPQSIERWAEEDLEKQFMNTKDKPSDALAGYISLEREQMKAFLLNETSICPLCHHDASDIPIEHQHKLSTILTELRKFNPETLSKTSATKALQKTFLSKWNDDDIHLSLKTALHAYLLHKKQFLRLVALGTLTGPLPEWLFEREFHEQKKKTFVGLSKEKAKEHPLFRWLKTSK